MNELVTIATFDFSTEAHTMKVILEEQGFTVFLQDDDLVTLSPHRLATPGVKLQVAAASAEAAERFVEQFRQRRIPATEEQPVVTFACEECGKTLSLPAKRRGGVETCPHCHQYIDVPD